jgi:sugar phosphate isomerase/epimerase
MDRLGIENLSTFGLHPVEFIHLAADLGCGHVSLNLRGSANRLEQYPEWSFLSDAALRRNVRAALDERGIAVSLLEGFPILPAEAEDFGPGLDIAAEFGARAICAVSLDKDAGRTHAEYARLTEQAVMRGIVVTTEACAGAYRKFGSAVEAVEAVGNPTFQLLIDTMHFYRWGNTAADLAALDPATIGHIQLCDVPMPAQIESYMEEALHERRAPGDGDLPLDDFLAQVPTHVPIGLEVPIRSEALAGVGPHERLSRIVAAARAVLT